MGIGKRLGCNQSVLWRPSSSPDRRNQGVKGLCCDCGHHDGGCQSALPYPGLPGLRETVDAKKGQARLAILPGFGLLVLNRAPRAHCEGVVLRLHNFDCLIACRL